MASVSPKAEVDPTAAKTMPELIRSAAAAYGEDIAVRMEDEGAADAPLSFVELDRRSAELARGLLARGVGKGTRVGFIFGNSPSFALMMAAISRIGAVAIPISTLIRANELVRVLRQSDVGGLIVQRTLLGHDYVERLCDALPALRTADGPDLRLPETPFLRWIASTGPDLPRSVRDVSWLTEAADTVSEDLLLQVESEVHTTDQMVEIYTSGSMALPKGVKHSHGPVIYRAHFIREKSRMTRGMTAPVRLPMFWVGGLMMALLPQLEIGATSVCTERTTTNSQVAMGSVLTEEDLKFYGQSGGIIWSLGMTETLGPYAYGDVLRAPGYPLSAPLDHIFERYEVRVYADGEAQGDGGRGEIQVRGYAVTSGLHKIERSAHFEPDGFFRTGDIGLVEGSRINFVGRDGDMIKTSGSNVSPAEVEMEMQQLDGIYSAYVLGLPDKQRGQVVVAAVVPREGADVDFDQVQATLKERLSSYKVPRAYVAISREEVPMLHSNKVGRRQLERLVAEKLGRT